MQPEQKFILGIIQFLQDYRSALRREFKKCNVSISVDQWLVLSAIGIEEGISQKDISDYTSKEPAAIMRMLDAMNESNWIARIPSQDDRRKYRVILSNEGRLLYEACSKIEFDLQKIMFKSFTLEEKRHLNSIIEDLRKSIN